jgi:hypothetical protein
MKAERGADMARSRQLDNRSHELLIFVNSPGVSLVAQRRPESDARASLLPWIGLLKGIPMCSSRFAGHILPARMQRSPVTYALTHISFAALL